jgi:single-stranded-DNA-specific exonuclease
MVKELIKQFSELFLKKTENKKIHLISHFDTDGITSAAILSKALESLEKQFSLKIIKQLTEEEIEKFPRDKIILLSDLGSASLESLSKIPNDVFIIDHHEITGTIGSNTSLLNPHLTKEAEELCTAQIAYLFSKNLSQQNKKLANLAIIGMVGDTMEKEISRLSNEILLDADVKIKKGLLLYPSTRPIDRTLEYSSRPFIPGVTGNSKGTFELLKEAGIERIEKSYKALIDLDDDEMKRLATAVTLRLSAKESSELIGNLYLIKFFNKIEDARELSAMINACSRMDKPEIALMLCLGNSTAKKKSERIYFNYRQHIISGLKYIDQNNKIFGREYVIINAKDAIKDTIIGTLASILSFSQVYKEGTIIITMAYNNDKIKVSARMAGRNPKSPRNLKELMDSVTFSLGGESGGHKEAAGCIIDKKDEEKFIEIVKKKLEYELIKV